MFSSHLSFQRFYEAKLFETSPLQRNSSMFFFFNLIFKTIPIDDAAMICLTHMSCTTMY